VRAPEPAGLPRWVLTLVVVLPTLLLAGVLIGSVVIRTRGVGPLPLATVPAPEAGSRWCAELVAALPEEIETGEGDLDRRALADPAPQGAAAWGDPPVVLRCGLARPAELTPSSRLIDVSGVQFLQVPGTGATSWVVVDRPVYVVLTLPEGSGSAAVQQVAGAVRTTLPRAEVDA